VYARKRLRAVGAADGAQDRIVSHASKLLAPTFAASCAESQISLKIKAKFSLKNPHSRLIQISSRTHCSRFSGLRCQDRIAKGRQKKILESAGKIGCANAESVKNERIGCKRFATIGTKGAASSVPFARARLSDPSLARNNRC